MKYIYIYRRFHYNMLRSFILRSMVINSYLSELFRECGINETHFYKDYVKLGIMSSLIGKSSGIVDERGFVSAGLLSLS